MKSSAKSSNNLLLLPGGAAKGEGRGLEKLVADMSMAATVMRGSAAVGGDASSSSRSHHVHPLLEHSELHAAAAVRSRERPRRE